jgi:hypothetical protein
LSLVRLEVDAHVEARTRLSPPNRLPTFCVALEFANGKQFNILSTKYRRFGTLRHVHIKYSPSPGMPFPGRRSVVDRYTLPSFNESTAPSGRVQLATSDSS